MVARPRRLGRRATPWSETDHLQLLHDLVEQVRHALPVLGRDFQHRVETEPVDLEGCVLRAFVVSLVDGHDHRMPGLPQVGHDHLIRGNQSFTAVDDQNQQIGPRDRSLPLADNELVQRILTGPKETSRIEQFEEKFRHVTGRPSASASCRQRAPQSRAGSLRSG